jgi:hypothetical protein
MIHANVNAVVWPLFILLNTSARLGQPKRPLLPSTDASPCLRIPLQLLCGAAARQTKGYAVIPQHSNYEFTEVTQTEEK